jgi:hypothetical protein
LSPGSKLFLVVVLDLIGDTDALGAMGDPVYLLMFGFAVADIEALPTEEFALLSAEVAMGSLNLLGCVVVFLLLVHFVDS